LDYAVSIIKQGELCWQVAASIAVQTSLFNQEPVVGRNISLSEPLPAEKTTCLTAPSSLYLMLMLPTTFWL